MKQEIYQAIFRSQSEALKVGKFEWNLLENILQALLTIAGFIFTPAISEMLQTSKSWQNIHTDIIQNQVWKIVVKNVQQIIDIVMFVIEKPELMNRCQNIMEHADRESTTANIEDDELFQWSHLAN